MEDARPLKNLDFDSTIMLDSVDRPWAGHLVAQLHLAAKNRSDTDLFPGLSLALFEQHLRHAAVVAGVLDVPHHPHAARHGGASTDALTGARTLAQIQQRGTWRCFRSVIRYEKHGTLQRQVAKLTPLQCRRALAVNRFAMTLGAGCF
jgi:hypothetical protein